MTMSDGTGEGGDRSRPVAPCRRDRCAPARLPVAGVRGSFPHAACQPLSASLLTVSLPGPGEFAPPLTGIPRLRGAPARTWPVCSPIGADIHPGMVRGGAPCPHRARHILQNRTYVLFRSYSREIGRVCQAIRGISYRRRFCAPHRPPCPFSRRRAADPISCLLQRSVHSLMM